MKRITITAVVAATAALGSGCASRVTAADAHLTAATAPARTASLSSEYDALVAALARRADLAPGRLDRAIDTVAARRVSQAAGDGLIRPDLADRAEHDLRHDDVSGLTGLIRRQLRHTRGGHALLRLVRRAGHG
jgi:hypothetical protein